MTKQNMNKIKSPIKTILLLTLGVMIISFLMSLVEFDAQQATIVNNQLETSLITVKNIFSIDGLRFFFGYSLTNFQALEPLAMLIIAFISISLLSYSGLIKAVANSLEKTKPMIMTLIILIISMAFSFFGDYSYLFLIPLVATLYKVMDKNPITGIITVFLGLTAGYGVGLIYNNNDYLLGLLTQKAATVEVDKNYSFKLLSTFYIMFSSAIMLSVILTYCIEKIVSPKLSKYKNAELIDEVNPNEYKILITFIVFILGIVFSSYLIIPGFPGSGLLLDSESPKYIAKLFSDTAPFKDAFPYIMLINIFIASFVFKKTNKVENDSYFNDITTNCNGYIYILILMFFMSQLIAVINWTNIGQVLAAKIVNGVSTLQFSGAPLIITLFLITIVISVFIPDLVSKWMLMSPLIVPLFMRSNITPDFTQFIFKVADGVGKLISPSYIYFIITLGFLQIYDKENNYGFWSLNKMLSQTILIIIVSWLVIILGWYIIGLPIGIDQYATL